MALCFQFAEGEIEASVMICLMVQGQGISRARRVSRPLVLPSWALPLYRGRKKRKGGKRPRVFPTISGAPGFHGRSGV